MMYHECVTRQKNAPQMLQIQNFDEMYQLVRDPTNVMCRGDVLSCWDRTGGYSSSTLNAGTGVFVRFYYRGRLHKQKTANVRVSKSMQRGWLSIASIAKARVLLQLDISTSRYMT